jgi:hypothetical protein
MGRVDDPKASALTRGDLPVANERSRPHGNARLTREKSAEVIVSLPGEKDKTMDIHIPTRRQHAWRAEYHFGGLPWGR